MKNLFRVILLLTFFSLSITLRAQNVISPYLDLQGPLYARENINTLNKAANGWIPWAIRNTSLSETKIDLTNILSLNVSGSIGVGTAPPTDLLLAVKRSSDGNIAVFEGPNAGLHIQGNTTSVDLVGYSGVSGYKSIFIRSGANGLLLNTLGNVGIGTTTPTGRLDINGNGNHLLNFTNKIMDADYADMLSIRSATKGSVLNLVSSRSDAGPLGALMFTTTTGWLDSHANIAGIVGGRAGTDPTAGGYLSFWTKYGSGDIPKENMRLTPEGNLAIGTIDPRGFKLAVKGKTITEEVVVQLHGSWPDYVFSTNYKLPSLSELEQYIKTNKHLPEVPTAEQVKENGLSLGEMNAILLKKVEELTMYLIEQNKSNQELKEQVGTLQAEMKNCKHKRNRK